MPAMQQSQTMPVGRTERRVGEHDIHTFDGIIKSHQDKCSYRHITLANGLQALLISEPDLDKSGAALDVNVGHFSDPDNIPGLAHFLEHLLFMGTEKYPDENEYGQYLSSHGGYSNAFTAQEHTNYFFEVASGHFDGALDRFAQFFIAPLFNSNGTERELLAVDSEHKKNVKDDHWRLSQLEKTLANPEHPYSHFGTGNLQTLKDIPEQRGQDIRKVLIDFYACHYSANLMQLVVYGKESLADLEQMVVTKFTQIPNQNKELTTWKGVPLDKEHFGKIIRAKTIKELRSLYIVWQLPDLNKYRLSKPDHYFTHLLGHEGKGSILSLLKHKGWASGLGAGSDNDGRGYSFFQISIDLSIDGQKHIDDIIAIIFQYLEHLRFVGPQRWIFEENKKLEEIDFRFMEKGSPSGFAYKTAGNMHYYPPELILKGPRVSLEYNEEALKLVLDSLSADNFRVLIASSDSISDSLAEKWYGTEYKLETISADLMKFIKTPTLNAELSLPSPNEFIPDQLTAKQSSSPIPVMHPQLLVGEKDARFKLWHKQDDIFETPKGCFQLLLLTPVSFSSARDFIRTYLFIEMLRDALTEVLYEAEVASLSFEIGQTTDGVYLSSCGYDEKLPLLLETVVKQALNFKGTEERFKVIKEKYSRWLKSLIHDNPYSLVLYYLNGLQLEKHWWYWEKLEALDSIELVDVNLVSDSLVSAYGIEALCHGNYKASEAINMFNNLLSSFNKARLEKSVPAIGKDSTDQDFDRIRISSLKVGQDLIFSPSPIENINSAIDFYLEIGSLGDLKLRNLALLFSQIFHEPFFNLLRTQEQLGYIVRHQSKEKGPSIGLRFIIQSELDPLALDERIEVFISNIPAFIDAMKEEEFEANVTALVNKLLAKKRRMTDETQVYWNQILLHQYEFERIYTDAKYLENFTKADMVAFVNNFVLRGAPQRRKLAVHLWGGGEAANASRDAAYAKLDPNIKVYKDPQEFSKVVDLYPLNYSIDNNNH